MKKKTTDIQVNGERWSVPRGFGRDYAWRAKAPAEPDVLRDLLELVGYTANPKTVATWPLRKRVEAEAHAANEHLRASDNPIPRHPRPEWMPDPWKGPRCGEGVWEGPGPTDLSNA